MKLFLCLFSAIALAPTAIPQVQLISGNYFPADAEFRELQKIVLEESFENPDEISGTDDGSLLLNAGCEKLVRRVYATENEGALTIDAATLADARAAYSLLTLLGDSVLHDGPPGVSYTSTDHAVLFAKGREWVRLKGPGVSANLMMRIAKSMSNRIDSNERTIPSLIAHLPPPGYDSASLRYFTQLNLYETYAGDRAEKFLKVSSAVEVAQARYSVADRTGNLFLLGFPTPQVAEEYFEALPTMNAVKNSVKTLFAKRVGPLVAILEGDFDPGSADRILHPLKYEYSIRWIYDERNQTKIVWGVPTRILGTVVKSLLFVAMLCLVSVVAGAGLAFLRFGLRRHAAGNSSDQTEQTDLIRLRLK